MLEAPTRHTLNYQKNFSPFIQSNFFIEGLLICEVYYNYQYIYTAMLKSLHNTRYLK